MSDTNAISIDDLNEDELALLFDIRMLTESQRNELAERMQSFIEENDRK